MRDHRSWIALSEQHCTKPDHRGAFLHRDRVVTRHAHRQLRQCVALALTRIPELPEQCERTPLFRLIFSQSAHGHQTSDAKPSELPKLIEQDSQSGRHHPTLLGLIGAVDLHQNILGYSGPAAVQLSGQVDPVHGMDESKTADRASSLVALQSADEVPLNRQIAGGFLLLERLLDPIFSHIAEPRCYRGSDRFRAVRLGHTDDAHRMPPSPGCLAAGHGLAHNGQPVRQAWEIHNLLIYWRMVGY